jgi:hypothetical protein
MMIPLGAILPWSISPGAWDAPPTPAKIPRIEAAAIVILPLNLSRTMIVTSAVSAMIEPNRTTRNERKGTYKILMYRYVLVRFPCNIYFLTIDQLVFLLVLLWTKITEEL